MGIDATRIELLKSHLAQHPQSPLFARLADEYLQAGKIEEAVALCQNGVQWYPHYVTGYLVLGKCYYALKRFTESRKEFQQVLDFFPHSELVQQLFEQAIDAEMKVSYEEFIKQKENEFQGKANQRTLKEYLDQEEPSSNTELEELTRKLQTAKRVMPSEVSDAESLREFREDHTAVEGLVTPTLAEIYTMQGAYEAAIKAYSILIEQNPQGRERFEKKIQELREKIKARDAAME